MLFTIYINLIHIIPLFLSLTPCPTPQKTLLPAENSTCIAYMSFNISYIKEKTYIFTYKSRNFLYSECQKTAVLHGCKPKIAEISLENEGINMNVLNHSYISEIERKIGLFIDGYKLIPDVNGQISIYRLKSIKNNEILIDFIWKRLENNITDIERPRYREEAGLIKIVIDNHEYLLLLGGVNDFDYFDDCWLYSIEQYIWLKVKGNIPKIKGHSMSSFHDHILIFGGNINGKTSKVLYICSFIHKNDAVSIDIAELTVDNIGPSAREGHISLVKDEKLLIFGGCDYERSLCYNDFYSLDLSQPLTILYKWTIMRAIADKIPVKPRENPAYMIKSNEIVILGGCDIKGICYKDGSIVKLYRKCLNDCKENEYFFNGKCRCNAGFYGDSCEKHGKICENSCFQHGECLENGTCACYDGFFGQQCEYEYCKDQCNARGYCDKSLMRCLCDKEAYGVNCKGNCIKNCNDNGYCYDGKCICFEGFQGNSCEQRGGIEGCWVFNDFDEGMVKKGCIRKDIGQRDRYKGFFYIDQRRYIFKETRVYNKESPFELLNGILVADMYIGEVIIQGKLYGFQDMYDGYVYEKDAFLSISNRILTMQIKDILNGADSRTLKGIYMKGCKESRDCFGNGFCDSSDLCVCAKNYSGLFCQFYNETSLRISDSVCLYNCWEHGVCNVKTNKCECYLGYSVESSCETTICPNNCTSKGICDMSQAKCICKPGYIGPSCEKHLQCPNNCTSPSAGYCSYDSPMTPVCICYRGYYGNSCQHSCISNCSNHGICDSHRGQCICETPYEGEQCERYKACKYNCSGRGSCVKGECICERGYTGNACELEVSCYGRCGGKGQCIWGICVYEEENIYIKNDETVINRTTYREIEKKENHTYIHSLKDMEFAFKNVDETVNEKSSGIEKENIYILLMMAIIVGIILLLVKNKRCRGGIIIKRPIKQENKCFKRHI